MSFLFLSKNFLVLLFLVNESLGTGSVQEKTSSTQTTDKAQTTSKKVQSPPPHPHNSKYRKHSYNITKKVKT
nr:hypothetical protein [Deltaproteobacteria bacterium]